MAEEVPKGRGPSEKRGGKLTHPLVDRVLSKISQIEQKEEKETLPAKAPVQAKPEIPREAKYSLGKKINFVVKVFPILAVLSFSGWYLVSKSAHLKIRLVEGFSNLTHGIIREKDAIWIRRKVSGAVRKKGFSFPEVKIRKDVKGIPVVIGASEINVYTQDNVSTLNFVTSDPMDRVVTFYIREMERRDYRLVKADYWPGSDIGLLLFSREGTECTVNLVENERGGVNVAISYAEKG